MRLVEFQDIEVVNFKTYPKAHLTLGRGGLCFVTGHNKLNPAMSANDVGKTTLVADAFCWCLTGRTPGGLRNPDIKPWKTNASTEVRLCFKLNGEPRLLSRSANPNRLKLDGTEISQERLETLTGLTYDLLTNTILLGQGRPLFFDKEPAKKMELFSEALQLERWDQRSDAAKKRYQAFESDLTGLDRQKAGLDAQLASVGELLETAQQESEQWVVAWRKRKRASAAEIDQLRRDWEAQDKLLANALLRKDGAEAEVLAERRELKKIQDQLATATLEGERVRLRLETANRDLTRLAAEIKACATAKTCPTCGQPVTPKNLKEHLAELEKQAVAAQAIIDKGAPKKLVSTLEFLNSRAAHHTSYIQSFEAKVDTATAAASRLQGEVATLKARLTEAERVAKTEEENPHLKRISDLRTRQRAASDQLKGIETQQAKVTQVLECARPWVQGFKDIKLQLVDDILQELTFATASLLGEIGLGDWTVDYVIEKETKSGTLQRALNVLISSPESPGPVRWESWSGGAGQRLRLVGALALSDVLLNHVGVSLNIEIFDEPTRHMSDAGVENVIELLSARAKAGRTVFFIDHKAVQSTHFASVVTIVRDEQGSYIAGGEDGK
jgi:DNA repair exonuclease SbcCD ATPase subunit